MSSWIVVGGGFRGIIATHFLAKDNCSVTLVEDMPFLGGVMYSQEWRGFYVDMGCHMFDNVDDHVTEVLLEIMDGDVIPVDVKYASVTDGLKSDGVAVPDFTVLDRSTQERILYEIIESAAAQPQENATLQDLLRHYYGATVAERLEGVSRKYFNCDPNELEASAFASTPFRRIKVVPDQLAMLLKQSPQLDERIAASSADDPLKFYRDKASKYSHRHFYPRGKGMRSFCEKAQEHLNRLGVELVFEQTVKNVSDQGARISVDLSGGRRLEADRVLWVTDPGSLSRVMFGESQLGDVQHEVPIVLYYFKCPLEQVGDYSYIHDYSEDTFIFRASTPGVYGQQLAADGTTYVCFEIPTKLGSDLWESPDACADSVWREALALDVVRGTCPTEHMVIRVPVAFKLGKLGFTSRLDETMARIHDTVKNIVVGETSAFTKTDIVTTLENVAAF